MKPIFIFMLALPAALWAGGEDWWTILTDRISTHPQVIQSQALLRAAEAGLEEHRLSRWSLPLGVSLQGQSTESAPQVSGALSLEMTVPLGETPGQEQKRRTLEEALSLRQREFLDIMRKTTSSGVQAYWSFQICRQNLQLSREAVGIADGTLERARALWDLGQADLTLWSEAEEGLRKAELALVKAEQTAGESRRAWYSFLGRPAVEEEWDGIPGLKSDLPTPWHYDWRSTSSWIKNTQTLDQALWTLKTAETMIFPWSVGLTVQTPGDQTLNLGYSGADRQGNLGIRGNFSPVESPTQDSYRITLEGSFKPDLLNFVRKAEEEEQNYLAVEAASETAARDLENQALATKAAWEASLSALKSAKSALERALVQKNSLEAKADLGQALALELETARLSWSKASLALREAELGVFIAAIAAGESTENLLNIPRETADEKE